MVDFGVGAAVVALSALGCVPVTSCRGPTLGAQKHSQPAPMVVFYARRIKVPALMRAVEAADCQIVNNGAKLEIYADDVRKMHALPWQFALQIRARRREDGQMTRRRSVSFATRKGSTAAAIAATS